MGKTRVEKPRALYRPRQTAAMGDLIESIIAEGEVAIDSFLTHATRLTEMTHSTFPKVTLESIHADFGKIPLSTEINPKVDQLTNMVREESAIAYAAMRSAEMWLRMKEPAVSDGNNFGVDVQNYVIDQTQSMRKAIDTFADACRDYHWGRAEGLKKVLGDEKKSEDSSTTVDEEKSTGGEKPGDKKSEKKSTTTKMTKETPSVCADYKEYVISLDVQQYYRAYNALTDMRNAYLRAHQLFSKNMKRLSDPRGEGADGSSRNVRSMFWSPCRL